VGTRLILIEGMIGAGKSTMAGRLERRLSARGEKARAYLEFAEDHPIRTKAVDLLRAAHPEPVWVPGDVGEDGLARDRSVYAVEQWGRLATRCRDDGQTVILESTFLQNSVMPPFLNGAPAGKCQEIFTRIEEQLAPARPLLVYLRPADTAAAVARVHGARSAAWTEGNMASVAASPWARSRDLHGREAVIALYRAWEVVVEELFAGYSFPKIILNDPQDDWDAALRYIDEKARP
jgi:predicted kinase